MASLEAFVLYFYALDYADYARCSPIHIRHENTLTRIQKIISTLLCAACLSRTINFNACDRTKNNDSTKNYCDAVALTDYFYCILDSYYIVFLRWLVKYKLNN